EMRRQLDGAREAGRGLLVRPELLGALRRGEMRVNRLLVALRELEVERRLAGVAIARSVAVAQHHVRNAAVAAGPLGASLRLVGQLPDQLVPEADRAGARAVDEPRGDQRLEALREGRLGQSADLAQELQVDVAADRR